MSIGADVVVVGGGVVGASIAWHLTRRGAGRIALLEQSVLPGQGATQQSAGLLRVHHTLEADIALAAASLPWFRHWGERVGGSCGYQPTGFVMLVSAEHADALATNSASVTRHGVRSYLLRHDELEREYPGLRVDGVAAAAVEPDGGYGDAAATAASLRAQFVASSRGDLHQGVCAERLIENGGRVVGVDTNVGRLDCAMTVLAAGAWTATLAASIGWELPIVPQRIGLAQLRVPALAPPPVPSVIDDTTGTYFRADGPEGVLAGAPVRSACKLSSAVQPLAREDICAAVEMASRRLPAVANGTVVGSRAGFDGYTPDRHPLLGRSRIGPDGLVVAAGFSGGGFKCSPAVGELIADLVVDGVGNTSLLAPYDPDRFAADRPLASEYGYARM